MRSVLVLTMLFLPFLAGCTEPVQEPDPKDGVEPEPEPEPEPWTRRLFLLFPDPCPDEPIGNTTYNTSMESTPRRECGKSLADAATTDSTCATFIIHDPDYRLSLGQLAHAYLIMETGPGPVNVTFFWIDDDGIVAEGADEVIGAGRGYGFKATTTPVQRDSTTGLRFEVHAEDFSCGRIGVGSNGGTASAIWAEEG